MRKDTSMKRLALSTGVLALALVAVVALGGCSGARIGTGTTSPLAYAPTYTPGATSPGALPPPVVTRRAVAPPSEVAPALAVRRSAETAPAPAPVSLPKPPAPPSTELLAGRRGASLRGAEGPARIAPVSRDARVRTAVTAPVAPAARPAVATPPVRTWRPAAAPAPRSTYVGRGNEDAGGCAGGT